MFMWGKVKSLKISKIKGEDVDVVVSMLNAAYNAYEANSTPTWPQLPTDWSQHVLKVFQTSSVPKFNMAFYHLEEETYQKAAFTDCHPEWPKHEQLTLMATNLYHRLKATNEWDAPRSTRQKGLHMRDGKKKFKKRDVSQLDCYNCGKRGHIAPNCTEPRNEAKVQQAKDRAKRERDARKRVNMVQTDSGISTNNAATVQIDDLLYKRNKEGCLVCVDDKKVAERKAKGDRKRAAKASAAASAPGSTPASVTHNSNSASSSPHVYMTVNQPAPINPRPVPARNMRRHFARFT